MKPKQSLAALIQDVAANTVKLTKDVEKITSTLDELNSMAKQQQRGEV